MPLFLLFIAVPLIEIALFIEVGGWLGLWPTLAIVVLTALVGATLLRAQGLATFEELKRRLARGEDPEVALAHGALILAAGLLLLTPGFFTDAVGLALLVPAVRSAVIRWVLSRLTVVRYEVRGGRPWDGDPGMVDGEYEVVEPDEPPRPPRP